MIPTPTVPASPNERALAQWNRERQTGLIGAAVTLAETAKEGTLQIWKNGTLLDSSAAYTVVGRAVTLGVAAIAGDVFEMTYWYR